MSKKNTLFSILAISFTMVILSGCGVNGATAKEIVQNLEQKNYYTAKEIFEEATNELSEEKQEKLNSVVAKSVKEYLDKSFKEMKSDSSEEAFFYNTLAKIKEIGIDDKALDEKIESLRREVEEAEEAVNTESITEEVADSVDKDFEIRLDYERKITDEFLELIRLWGEVDKGNWKLNQLGYQQSVQELSKRLLDRIDRYRKYITIPKDKEEVYQFYFEYLDEVEQAMTKLDKASYSNLPTLFDEVKIHMLSASDYHDNYTTSSSEFVVKTDNYDHTDIMTEDELSGITGNEWTVFNDEKKFDAVSNFMHIMSEKENWVFGFSEKDYIDLIDNFYSDGRLDIQFSGVFSIIMELEEIQ